MSRPVNIEKGKKGFQKTTRSPAAPAAKMKIVDKDTISPSQQLEIEYSYDETFEKAKLLTNSPVSLMNRGERTYDEHGRVCRPSDTFNEYRAILYMQSKYPSMAEHEYRPSENMFASIDGAWYDSEGKLLGYSEIKSHPGKTMGQTTILNLRKWRKLVEQNKRKKTIFIAQYEDKIGWIEVSDLEKVVAQLSPDTIHDRQSVQRSTSREKIWRIPTSVLRIIEVKKTPLPVKYVEQLSQIEKTM